MDNNYLQFMAREGPTWPLPALQPIDMPDAVGVPGPVLLPRVAAGTAVSGTLTVHPLPVTKKTTRPLVMELDVDPRRDNDASPMSTYR